MSTSISPSIILVAFYQLEAARFAPLYFDTENYRTSRTDRFKLLLGVVLFVLLSGLLLCLYCELVLLKSCSFALLLYYTGCKIKYNFLLQ